MKEDGAHLSFIRRRARCVQKEARLLLLQRFGVNCNQWVENEEGGTKDSPQGSFPDLTLISPLLSLFSILFS